MKKALALVLALVLALSLGVSAFALEFVQLDKESTTAPDRLELETIENYEGYAKYFRADPEGGEYYLVLQDKTYPDRKLKNIEVTTTGPVSAEIVEFDSDKMTGFGSSAWEVYREKDDTIWYYDGATVEEKAACDKLVESGKYNTKPIEEYVWVNKDGTDGDKLEAGNFYSEQILAKIAEGKTPAEAYKFAKGSWVDPEFWDAHTGVKQVKVFDETTEKFCKDLAKALNDANRSNTRYYADSVDHVEGTKLLKLTVEPNYTAAYKLGSFKVTAKRDDGDRKYTKVSFEGYVISDVTIFEYEEVKWAGSEDEALEVYEGGYSDFWMSGVYSDKNGEYNEDYLRSYENATVVSTTAFRALRENKDGLKVAAGELLVTIPEIVSGQKGVNFAYKAGAVGNKETTLKDGVTAVFTSKYKSVLDNITFGFYGDQKIVSDFTVEADLGMNAYELREAFGEKVEEEDIITYYIVEGEKVVGQFTVDYMKDDIDEDLVLEINRKAGSTLGMYKVVLEAPATTPAEGEENPNTGAESIIGVVAAMAVVSVAAAAAVSLKK